MNEPDPIETLLRVTGRRPAVSADRTGRVRDAARARWMSEVAGRARRRRVRWVVSMASAAVAIVAVGLGFRMLRPPIPAEPSGVRVERVWNVAQLPVGSIVPRGYVVTTGLDARVALRAATGHSVRLDIDTTLRVISGSEFALERGAVYVDAHRGSAPSGTSIRINTPVGTVEDRGTQFEARLEGSALALRVREGVVTVQRRDERFEAREGQTLRLGASGPVDRTEDAATGAAWSWVEAIAPAMEIDGKSLLDFLHWIARERGVRLEFDDPGLAEKAPKTVLRGSIAGMTPEQAVTSVLATCGLRHRWEDGALVVGPGPERPRSP